MPLVAFLTDFGTRDAYAGILKGVVLNIAPQAQVLDVTHGVPPGDITSGALLLEESYSYFPNGTIFVAVVDPGVGSSRAAIAVQTERFVFIGPDNGLLHLAVKNEIASKPKHAIRVLNNPKFQLPNLSNTFHGRDIFSPAAAWLARGISFSAIGDAHASLAELKIATPVFDGETARIEVLRQDHFGNLITNLTRAEFDRWNSAKKDACVILGGEEIPVRKTYADAPPGSPVAYFGSGGRLEVGINQGRAADRFAEVVKSGLILKLI